MFNSIKREIDHIGVEQEYLGSDWTAAQYRLLDYYCRIMPRVFDVERCSIFVADHEGGHKWLTAGTGLAQRELGEGEIAESFVGETIRTGEAVYHNDVEQNDHFNREVVAASNASVRDVLCMPFRSLDGQKITGAVQMLNRDGGKPYTDEDKALLAEMLNRLEVSMESIFFRQDTSSIVARIYRSLRRFTMGALIAFFAVLVAFTLYWFSFFFIGSE
ncbi:MAG TPA: GAF domain-containing protein [Pseudomonadales bacterium]|nr:GAF domain-containing protein [Pseudomonadales bacterium]